MGAGRLVGILNARSCLLSTWAIRLIFMWVVRTLNSHHENEIAQSEAKTGKTFANYWLHNGFVTVGDDNEKMSKSLGNFVTVHDIIKTVDPQVLRFFMATTQYRRPIQYTQANLDEAANNLDKLRNAYRNLTFRLQDATNGTDTAVAEQLQTLITNFGTAMDDDFNVQNGVAAVYELAKLANVYAARQRFKRDVDCLTEGISAVDWRLRRHF